MPTKAPRVCWGCGESNWHATGGHYEDGTAIYECRECGDLSGAVDETEAAGNALLFVAAGLMIADLMAHSPAFKAVAEATSAR